MKDYVLFCSSRGFQKTPLGEPTEENMADFQAEEAAMPYNPDAQPATQVELVMRQHQGSLLGRPGVTGVGIGQSAIGDSAIVVYLLDRGYGTSIPKMLDGFPVVLKVTGVIEAQGR